jgi:hypothetical protein
VTLRLSSLWHPHVEFSRIDFTEPSVNLVHAANGRWNIESLLLQAAHTEAAPTAQRYAGPARRFPYIEATGARVNLKLGDEKMPVSLTDTDVALWLPELHQWHIRLEAHPARTDSSPGDAGTIRAEGTLGGAGESAGSLNDVPIDVRGDWRNAQLGGLMRLLLGRDAGVRGDVSLAFGVKGSIGRNTIATRVKVANARRADFVPDHTLSLEMACTAVAGDTFHSFAAVECRSPASDSSDPVLFESIGSVPDVGHVESASGSLRLSSVPGDTLFDWISIATPHPPTVVRGEGTLTGALAWGVAARAADADTQEPSLTGSLKFSGGSLAVDGDGSQPIPLGDVVVRSRVAVPAGSHGKAVASVPADSFELLPVELDLGGKQPAVVEGSFDAKGYTLHLSGTVVHERLVELAKAMPQFGDGLMAAVEGESSSDTGEADSVQSSEPMPIDLTATRVWGGPQVWAATTVAPPVRARGRRR